MLALVGMDLDLMTRRARPVELPPAVVATDVGRRCLWLEAAYDKSGPEIARSIRLSKQAWSDIVRGETLLGALNAGMLYQLYGCSPNWLYLGSLEGCTDEFKARVRAVQAAGGPKPRKPGRRPKTPSPT
jgi:hypothetical protein